MATSFAEIAAANPRGSAPSPAEIFARARAHEESLSRLLMAFVTSGLFFMLFPGTFLGVWNLLQISGRESVASISPAWLQAPRSRPSFRLGGKLYLGNRLLFHSQAAWHRKLDLRHWLDVLGNVDGWCGVALDRQRVSVGVASPSTDLRSS